MSLPSHGHTLHAQEKLTWAVASTIVQIFPLPLNSLIFRRGLSCWCERRPPEMLLFPTPHCACCNDCQLAARGVCAHTPFPGVATLFLHRPYGPWVFPDLVLSTLGLDPNSKSPLQNMYDVFLNNIIIMHQDILH